MEVPLWNRVSFKYQLGLRLGHDLHDKLEHYYDPGQGEIPMEKIQVPPPGTNDAAGTAFLIESPETNNVFENAGASYGRSHNGEDGVG